MEKEEQIEPYVAGMNYDDYIRELKTKLDICNKKRELIMRWFEPRLEEHIRLACDVCGMSMKTEYVGYDERIDKGVHIAKSMAMDPSEDNIRRVCWVLFYSFNSVYKNLMSGDMSVYHEEIAMDEMNIEYEMEMDQSAKQIVFGCISKCMNRMINKYRCNVRDNMLMNNTSAIGNVTGNAPFPSETKFQSPNTFWIGRKQVGVTALQRMTEKDRKKQILIWNMVSLSQSMD